MRQLISALALAATATTVSAAGVSYIATDNFNSYGVGAIAGQNGGTGFSGAWTGSTGASVVATTGADSPMSGNALSFTTPNADNAATRNLATTLTTAFYVSFDFQFDGGAVGNNDFLGLWFGQTMGPNIGLKSNCGIGGSCTADLFVRTEGVGGVFQQNITIGTTYSVVGLFEKVGNSSVYNRASLWVGDSLANVGSLGAADVVYNGASTVSSISRIGFRTANLDTNPSDRLLVDNLRIGVVPTPGTLALLGLGLVAAGLATRRRA
jgi:hypothetical protein